MRRCICGLVTALVILACAVWVSAASDLVPAASAGELTLWQSADNSSDLKIEGWLAADLRAFRRTEPAYDASWNVEPLLASARLGLRYRLNNVWHAHLDGEFAEANPDVQEAWFEYRPFELLGIRAGRVKVPFGLAPQASLPDYALLSPAMVFGNSKDFRDAGFMLHGDWSDGYLSWAIAAVTGSRDLSVDVNDKPDVVGRLVLHGPSDGAWWLRGLQLGASGSWGEGPIRHGFRGRTLGGHTFSDPPVIRGPQLRFGAEAQWDTRHLTLSGEWLRSVQEREGVTENQKVGTAYTQVGNLEPYTVTGWYVEATARPFEWFQADVDLPRVELSGRFERLDFGDGTKSVEVETGTQNLAPLTDSGVSGVTAGLHFLPLRNVRLSLVWLGLRFDDSMLKPDAAKEAAAGSASVPAVEPAPTKAGWAHSFFLRAQFEL